MGDEPNTIVVTTLFARDEIERWSACASTEVSAWPFVGHQLPHFFEGGILLLYALRVQAKLASWERQFQDLRESAGRRMLAPRANYSYNNCDRLIAETCGLTSCRFPSLLLELIHGLAENDG